jgi:eukaryotic-like serine/threonine-protein kinase
VTEPTTGPLFQLSSVPSGAEEFRAFYQRRVTMFLGAGAVFWGTAWILTTVLTLLTVPEDVLEGDNGRRVTLHFALVLALTGLWAAVRRGERSQGALRTLDVANTLLQALIAAGAVLLAQPVIRYRPDALLILAMTYALVLRSAVVPSSPRRTAVIGGLAALPMALAILVLYQRADAAGVTIRHFIPGDRSTPILYFAYAVVFSSLSVGASTFVSHVIFGLQREVQRAKQLGQYTLEREIGSGGMGVVYLGRHALLRRPTAIKLLLPDRSADSAVARFEREVQITSQLTHPNTIAVYDYGRTPDGTFYYAMEYLDGIDLETLVEEDGPQPPARVLHFLKQICGALAEAHHHGLIHRDIKPSNVIICERGQILDFAKVLDFGLARAIEGGGAELGTAGVTQAGQITGTPLYMSPEQIQKPESVDGRADLYALAAVGYYLLTGEPVFSGSTVVEICAHHLCSPVVPPSARLKRQLPAKLEAALLRCLEKDAHKRPRDAKALLEELAACDDVAAWTEKDALGWWQERGAALKSKAGQTSETSQTSHATIAVALTERVPASAE